MSEVLDVELVCRESGLDDWYCIERAVHDDVNEVREGPRGAFFYSSARISDADIEGTAEEMRAIATAILADKCLSFRRCAVDILHPSLEKVTFWSPRNSTQEAVVTRARARELATQILETLR